MSSKAEEAALAAARGITAVPDVEAEETPSSDETEETTDEVVEETVEDTSPFEVEVPDDLLMELALEEDEDPEEEEPEEEDDDDFSVPDPKLSKALARAQKEAAFYKERVVKSSRTKWEDEAKKFFPLAESVLPQIKAESRRSFLRQAKAAHDTVLPFVKTAVERVNAEKATAIENATAEARAQAEKAWGKPTVEGGPSTPAELDDQQKRLEKARRTGDFADTVRTMLFPAKRGE